MIFLIEYSRKQGSLIAIQAFGDLQQREAEDLRLETELALNRKKINHDIVLLQAESEDALHQTHCRYFGGFRQIFDALFKTSREKSQ